MAPVTEERRRELVESGFPGRAATPQREWHICQARWPCHSQQWLLLMDKVEACRAAHALRVRLRVRSRVVWCTQQSQCCRARPPLSLHTSRGSQHPDSATQQNIQLLRR